MRAGAALAPLKIATVTIDVASRGRVTGWSVSCDAEGHGTMPVLAPGRSSAIEAAAKHVEHEHRGKGRIVDKTRDAYLLDSRASKVAAERGRPTPAKRSSFAAKRKAGARISRRSRRAGRRG